MIKKGIDKTFNGEMHSIGFLLRDEMEKEAIKDDGIYSTFKFHNHWFPTANLTQMTLHYCKFDGDGCSWLPMQKKIFYKTCPELGDVTLPYVGARSLEKVADRIKLDVAKNDNAIWSTIKVEPCHDHFDVSYEKVYVKNSPYDPYVENTKKTLQRLERLRENTYYGLYPRHSGMTYNFGEKLKVREDIKDSLVYGLWEARAKKDTKEKEKKDMNVTLLVVPEEMSKNFVNKVKADYQSNNLQRLFVASTDIDYNCEYEPIKTKYDLFENWVKTGKVDVVYFMLGFEKDPDVRAFEAFVRGITEFSGKVDVRVAYQRDDILNDANNLRTAYFDEADSKEDLENAANKVVKEAKTMQDIYGLDDEGLEAIKYSKGRIEVSEGLIMDKIMDTAFADDEADKPKKGGKK